MNILQLDLKLLVVFDTVMAERSTVRAGHRLGLSQPAVSNALARLRNLLKDDLFVRGPGGMRPTPRALELASPVRQSLAYLRGALDPAAFAPADAQRTFTLAMADYAAAWLLPPLAERLEREAPGIDVRVRPSTNMNAPEMLDAGEIDFAVGLFPDPPERFGSLHLDEDRYVCAMREGHPLAGGPLALEGYAAARHLLVSLSGEPTGIMDRLLAARGLERRVAMTVNQFNVALRVLTRTDLVLTVASHVALRLAGSARLRLIELPLQPPATRLTLLWHGRLGSHPAFAWLRSALVEACSEAPLLDRTALT